MLVTIPLVILTCFIAWLLRPRKNSPKPRIYAGLSVALLSLSLAAVSVAFQFYQNSTGSIQVSDVSNSLFIAGLIVIAAALLTLVGFAAARKRDIVLGIGFGVCTAVFFSVIELGLLEWLGGV